MTLIRSWYPHALREHLGAAVAVVSSSRRRTRAWWPGIGTRAPRSPSASSPSPKTWTRAVASEASSSAPARARPARDPRHRHLHRARGAPRRAHQARRPRPPLRHPALEPASERAFISACNNRRADIIALPERGCDSKRDPEDRPSRRPSRRRTCAGDRVQPALMDVGALPRMPPTPPQFLCRVGRSAARRRRRRRRRPPQIGSCLCVQTRPPARRHHLGGMGEVRKREK